MMSPIPRPARLAALFAAVALSGGCTGNRFPVAGKVAYPDGSPVTKGTIMCQPVGGGKDFVARGAIQPDGTYKLGIEKPGDGVYPGSYKALIVPPGRTVEEEETQPPPFDPKFSNFDSSGLKFEVPLTGDKFDITVTKLTNWKKPAASSKAN